MEQLTAKTEKKGDIHIIRLEGTVDSITSSTAENAISALVRAKKFRIIIDLDKVDYVSSAGWGIFVAYVKEARANKGDIKLANMRDEVRDIFEILDFANVLQTHKTVESAEAAFQK